MKESIYTIPISEVFEPKSGCPVCRLRGALDRRWVEYITGAAMMEPDIRMLTNAQGFCGIHMEAMLGMRNRLSVALLLQSRLEAAASGLASPPKPAIPFGRRRPRAPEPGCFLCDRVGAELLRIADNIASVWVREAGFRELFANQEYICLPHAGLLRSAARRSVRGKACEDFCACAGGLAQKGLAEAKRNIDEFCMLFDHRSAGAPPPPEHVATAIEAALRVLGCEPPGSKGESTIC